jgi:predicted dehydrogenase
MSNETIRVGVIGAGANTVLRHLPGLQAIEGVEVVSVCNRSRGSSEKVAKEFGIARVYDHWRELIAADDSDAIVIGTWPYMHCPMTLAALDSCKHVLCEARMAMDLAEAQAMLETARSQPDLVAQLVPSPMTLRLDKTIQRLIAEDYLGDIYLIEMRESNMFSDEFTWRHDVDLSGLNIMSLGIWYEALMRWVGVAKRVVAKGQVFTKMRRRADGTMAAVFIPDHIDVIAEMACGAQGHFQVSSATEALEGKGIYLCGSQGMLRILGDRLYGKTRNEQELKEIEVPSEEGSDWRVEEEFINAIRGEEAVKLTTFTNGFKYMAFTQAVAESMATGNEVAVAL